LEGEFMEQIILNCKTGNISLEEVPLSTPKRNEILVKNHYSAIYTVPRKIG